MLPKWTALAANPNAPTIAATAIASPITALRTGTAVRPCPGSRARRDPATAVGGIPTRANAAAIREGRSAPTSSAVPRMPARAPAIRHPVSQDTVTAPTMMRQPPIARTAPSTSMPGVGSMKLANPSGVSGDTAIVAAMAMRAPPIPTTAPEIKAAFAT